MNLRFLAPRFLALGLSFGCAAQVLAAPATGSIDVANRGNGTAIVIGGGLKADNEEVWTRIVALAGGKGARFVVLGTASEDPVGSAKDAVDSLTKRGAVAEVLPVSPMLKDTPIDQAVKDPALIAKVRAARGIYFTGGAQERIVDHLYPGGKATPLLEAIWDVYRSGGVVAGTSAGAAIMSATMFRDAPNVLGVMKGEFREGHEVDRGLGFVGPDLFVDQHFLKRGRFGRMIPLMQARGYVLGLGVEENSAAVVHGDTAEIVGGKAMLVDLSEARTDAALGAFNLKNIRIALLDRGDRVALKTHVVTPSALKLKSQKLDPQAPDYKPYNDNDPFYIDMFGDGTIASAMSFLIDSNRAEVRGIAFDPRAAAKDPKARQGFSFRVYKGPGSVGWYNEDFGGEDYTILNLYLDIAPIRMADPMYTPWTPAAN